MTVLQQLLANQRHNAELYGDRARIDEFESRVTR